MKRIPISSSEFDPTEVVIPWKLISEEGFGTVFTTPNTEKGVKELQTLSKDHFHC